MENFVLLSMDLSDIYIYIYVYHTFVIWRVHGRFFIDSAKENGHLGNMNTLHSSMMKKMSADSKTKGKKPGTTHDLHG